MSIADDRAPPSKPQRGDMFIETPNSHTSKALVALNPDLSGRGDMYVVYLVISNRCWI